MLAAICRRCSVALLLLAAPGVALAADKPAKTKPAAAKVKAPSITMPSFGDIPSAAGVNKPKEEKAEQGPSSTAAADAQYSVVKVQHAKAFVHGPNGIAPAAPFDAVPLVGDPPTTEKFTTVLRVRCPQRVGAAVDLVILDPRGDTAMSATGQLLFRQGGPEEIDYTVDWDPTPLRAGGVYSLLVRVAGQPLGTWPLKVAAPRK